MLTGYDIIFFWVVRMMMFGLYAMDDVPFRTVALTGLIRDKLGRKMSKSKGMSSTRSIGSTPTARTRFGSPLPVARILASTFRSTRSGWPRHATSARSCGTLPGFALLNGATVDGELLARSDRRRRVDRVTVARGDPGDQTISTSGSSSRRWQPPFTTSRGMRCCDWYVELAKVTLPGPRGDVTRRVLGEVLDVLLRLLHPLMPFVTEVLWTTLTGRESIVIAPWPIAEPSRTDRAAEAQIARVQAVVSEAVASARIRTQTVRAHSGAHHRAGRRCR